jgi:SAM-dependent methyltransferase
MNFTDYLLSKRAIDDRSLNQRVLSRFGELLSQRESRSDPWFVEVGAGVGTMLERLVQWGLVTGGRYTLVDSMEANTAEARRRLDGLFPDLDVEVVTGDLYEVLARIGSVDAILAHAVLDLVDPSTAIAAIVRALAPGGLGYLTLNFDGETSVGPPHPADDLVIEAYHRSMSGDSHCGRHVLAVLAASDQAQLMEAGSSDWVVYARGGAFSDDEARFLDTILHFFATSVPETGLVPAPVLAGWLESRRQQVADGTLTLIAHQLDFLFRKRPRRL